MNETKKNDPNSITPFAVTNYRDIRRIFGIKQKNRRGHMYLIGKTGTGKSTLLLNMIVSDIREGRGVALIDPHGDLAERVLDFVPKERIDDVIYFNPGDLEHPIAFNPLRTILSPRPPSGDFGFDFRFQKNLAGLLGTETGTHSPATPSSRFWNIRAPRSLISPGFSPTRISASWC